MVRLIPRDGEYYRLLGELMGRVRAGGALLTSLFSDDEGRAGLADDIKDVERECDDLTGNITTRLNATFITPIDREDIHLLATRTDDIMDTINGLARWLEISNAYPLRPDIRELGGILSDALLELDAAFGKLAKRDGVAEHTKKVRHLEKDGDTLYAEALQRLFNEEANAIEVIKWSTIYEAMEESIDRCKHLAQILDSVVVKHS